MKTHLKYTAAALALGLGFTGLSGAVMAEHHGKAAIEAAVMSAERTDEEKARDADRKPAEVLAFAGLEPGMVVLDINSGGGYYSEILARAVGDDGMVYAHNGPVYWAFVKDEIAKRYEGRFDNVELIHGDSEAVDLPEGSVDLAIMVLAYHDYYFQHEARSTPQADVPAALKSFRKALKPDGKIVIIDHVGPAGADAEAMNKLHRIDPALVKKQMMEAGFTLAAESDLLANADDDPNSSPFAPEIRGKTNRFIHLYKMAM